VSRWLTGSVIYRTVHSPFGRDTLPNMNHKPTKATIVLTLPDKSRVNFDTKTGRFYSVNGTGTQRRSSNPLD